jgi:hypothetical protein
MTAVGLDLRDTTRVPWSESVFREDLAELCFLLC